MIRRRVDWGETTIRPWRAGALLFVLLVLQSAGQAAPYVDARGINISALDNQGSTLTTFRGSKASDQNILVKLRHPELKASDVTVDTAIRENGLRAGRVFRHTGIQRLVIDQSLGDAQSRQQRLAEKIERLRATGLYEFVEPDYRIQASLTPTDTALNNDTLWGLSNTGQSGGSPGIDINILNGWDITTGSANVVIAVIDSGIRFGHQDLSGNLWVNPGEIPANGIDDDLNGYVDDVHGINAITEDGDPEDNNNHGTHVAGTIAATGFDAGPHIGVAFNSKLMVLKALEADGGGYISDAIESIEYAIDQGADIINASWGDSPYSQALRDAIALADDAGILFVAAAGNSGSNNDLSPDYPSSYPEANIVSVAAIDRNGRLASFSNYGISSVHMAAPGESIYSTSAASDTSYRTTSGTSMAAPHVTGILALLASHFPDDDHLTLKSRLTIGAQPVYAIRNRVATGGIPDAYASLSADADGELEVVTSVEGELVADRLNTVFVQVNDLFPVLDASVSGQFDDLPSATFLDNGIGVDATANDGIYSGRAQTPSNGSESTLYVTAAAPGKTTRNVSQTYPLLSAPTNDDFANRILLSGPAGVTMGSNRLASAEPEEPLYGRDFGAKTVWWEWNAPDNNKVTFSTEGSELDTILRVFSGDDSFESLRHTYQEEGSDWRTVATFTPIAGASYKIQLDGYQGDEGGIQLSYPAAGEPGPPVITSEHTSADPNIREGDYWSAYYIASGAGTVTYQWYFNGEAIPGATEFSFSLVDATLDDEGNYTLVASNHLGSVTTDPIFVSVEEYGGPPVNDNISNAIELTGDSGSVTGSNIWATYEYGVDFVGSVAAPVESVWWTWTAPEDGLLEVDTLGSDFDTVLAGVADNNFDVLAANDDHEGLQSRIVMPVRAQFSYMIMVDGYRNQEGLITLNYAFTAGATLDPPPNDNFAEAIDLSDTDSYIGTTFSATAEPGEPEPPAWAEPLESVWFSWSSERCNNITIDTPGSYIGTSIAVYTGESLETLSLVESDLGDGYSGSSVTFSATGGVRYYISVDGRSNEEGRFTLKIDQIADHSACASVRPMDITEAGQLDGVGQIALHARDPDSLAYVSLASAAGGKPNAEISFFNPNWESLAISTLKDSNLDGNNDDPAIAMLAIHRTTQQIKAQMRRIADGNQLTGNIPFFNSNWLPIDIAVVNDLNGDGISNDPALAVLAQHRISGRSEVEVIRAFGPDQTPVFKEQFVTREWLPVAVESYVYNGETVIAMLATSPEKSKSVIRRKRASDGESLSNVFAFGFKFAARDLAILPDGNLDGESDDPALMVVGTKVPQGITRVTMRDAASGQKLDTIQLLGRGFAAEKLAVISDSDGNGLFEVAASADDESDGRVLVKIRDIATETSSGEIWIGDRPSNNTK